MEISSKLIDQIALKTRPEIEEIMLIITYIPFHEAHQSQPLQSNKKEFKIDVTFLSGFKSIFKVTNKKNKFCCTMSSSIDDFNQLTVPPGTYGIESLNNEIKRIIGEEFFFTKAKNSFTIKPSFSILGFIVEISSNITGNHFVFTSDYSIRDLLCFRRVILHEEYNLHIIRLIFYHLIKFYSRQISLTVKFSKDKRTGMIFN